MGALITLIALVMLASIIAFIIGLFKILFNSKEKALGIKLITYSVIVFIIGFGSCSLIFNGF